MGSNAKITIGRLCVLVSSLGMLPAAALAEAPMSAIDWLSSSVSTPAHPLPPAEPKVTGIGGAMPKNVIVSVLGGPSPDSAGILPSRVTGLPNDIWGLGEPGKSRALFTKNRVLAIPAWRRG
jgi:hypothetical protein